jgi:FkbM family methyltransferase
VGHAGTSARFSQALRKASSEVRVIARDERWGLIRVSTPDRPFWIQAGGEHLDGERLAAYLLAEHRWMSSENPSVQVKPGDIVLDCGAHAGFFTDKALRLGAAKVVAVEIDPANLECLRRNFPEEIAMGRVVVHPKGVWSREGSMPFHVGLSNSGMGSLVMASGPSTIPVPLTRIDTVVRELDLPGVNYIKMDIEGAEREALAGAQETLRRFRPALMMDFYHLPDDPEVLPRLVRNAHRDYRETCGPCERTATDFRPHVVYFR